MTTTRQERVKELLKLEISDIIRREMKDPRLGFITVTDAQVTADLQHAKVFVSILGDEAQKKESMKVLQKAAKFIRSGFAKRANMKTTPEIVFMMDTSVDQGVRIFELLEKIKKEDVGEGT
ncbi:MAG: 30S ribosome-binding factor RbfA [Armatimonadota bacterium]|nr:30S ribosome-binding factor RbfA [Armatimonadota bacterium]